MLTETKNAHISSSGYYGVIWNFPKFPLFQAQMKKIIKRKKILKFLVYLFVAMFNENNQIFQ